MSTRRRVIVRPAGTAASDLRRLEQRRQRVQQRLDQALAAMTRWQRKLVRALNAVVRAQKDIARLNRQLRTIPSPETCT